MSDALSDIAKDGYRAEAVNSYYSALLEWLKDRTSEGEDKVRKAASYADAMGSHGYWSSPTHLKRRLDERLRRLMANDELEWVAVIAELEPWCASEFLEASPLKGKTLVLHKSIYGPGVIGMGRECRHFKWVWSNKEYQIGDNGRWEACG